jgi:predicted acylesterase/phospholipase RssA
LREGKVKVFTNKDMTDELGCSILLASATIPGMFPMVEVSGEVYVDGAVLMNPLKLRHRCRCHNASRDLS